MNKSLSSTLLLVISGATISCAQADPPRRLTKMSKPELEKVRSPDFTYAKIYEEVSTILSAADRCYECRPMSGTFLVEYEMHYGYSVIKEDDLQKIMTPIFINKDDKRQFDNFFSQESLEKSTGKRIYCQCSGDSLERYGSVFYGIRNARLFVR